ncbi:9398_t:CDS:2, partial [Acaulospora colombiana]
HPGNSTSEGPSKDSIESSLKLFQENRYPAIQTLTWNGSVSYETLRHCSVITTSITSLRKVVFSEAYARKDANDFCEVLLRMPTACPNLETIAFHCYPSWDLLFHMLLRRNFMPGSIVTPLRFIHLPGYPSKTFLTPLIDLLSQRVPLLPALSQIALSFRNGVFDPTLAEIQVIDAHRELPEQPKAKLEQAQNNRAPSSGSIPGRNEGRSGTAIVKNGEGSTGGFSLVANTTLQISFASLVHRCRLGRLRLHVHKEPI